MSNEPFGQEALSALPSPRARVVAFVAIMAGGLFGLLAGYAVVDALSDKASPIALVVGAVVGAAFGAGGTSVLAVLGLRASPEWRRIDIEP